MRDHLAHTSEWSVSYSELNTLAQCEQRWEYNYHQRQATAPSQAMEFGTLMHALIGEWWATGRMRDTEVVAAEEGLSLPAVGQRSIDAAGWLRMRYMEQYGDLMAAGWRLDPAMPAGEHSLMGRVDTAALPPEGGEGCWEPGHFEVWGTADGYLLDPDGKRWLVERKTMADWRRLDLVNVTPQETLYVWLARKNGIEIEGVIFDAIKSYQWTRDKHPPGDSFQRIELYRDQPQIDSALEWTRAILERRRALWLGTVPIRNIGQACTGCSYQADCFDSFSFPSSIDTIWGDSDE